MLEPGHAIPTVNVNDRAGAAVALAGLLDRPTALVFLKSDCETTRMALPVLESWRRYEPDVKVLAISQETPDVTDRLYADLDIEFDTVFDRPDFEASAGFDIPAVPSVFLIEDGMIIRAGTGWYRDEAEQVTIRLAEIAGQDAVLEGVDDLPPFRPG